MDKHPMRKKGILIKKDVFMMSLDGQLFINQRTLRDEDGGILVKKGLISDYHHKK